MGKTKQRPPKEPKVRDATITEDGCIVIKFNERVYPHTADALFTPEALLALVKEYGVIPPTGTNDYDGVPLIDYEDIFKDDGDAPERNGEAEDEEEGERE